MYGANLGRALMSVGDDVTRASASEQAMRIEQMRDARERDIEKMRDARERAIAELARKVQLEAEKIRAAAGIGIVGHNLSDEQLAAAAGMPVQRYLAIRKYLSEGQRPPVANVEGEAGNGPTTDASSDIYSAEEVLRAQYATLLPIVGPRGLSELQKKSKDRFLFEKATSPNPQDRELARQAARALRGENRYRSEGGQNIDEHLGFIGPTGKSAAETEAFNALRRLRDAQAAAARAAQTVQPRDDSGSRDVTAISDKELLSLIEAQRKIVNEFIGDPKRRAHELNILDRMLRERDRRLNMRLADQAPTPTPAPTPAPKATKTPASPYKEGQYLFGPKGDMYVVEGGAPRKLKEGERITGRDGKTYVIRNGRPVPQ